MAELLSAKVSSNTLTMVYDEAMSLADANQLFLYTSTGVGIDILNGLTGNGTSTWILTLGTAIASTDYLVGTVGWSAIISNSSQYLPHGTMFVGGDGNTTIDLSSNANGYESPFLLFGNGGSDTLIAPSWSQDIISLNETTAASDTVKSGDQWMDDPYNQIDLVTGFNVSGTTTNDKLNLLSGTIAANVTDANGTDVGLIAFHSIVDGIVTFKNTAGTVIIIDTDAEIRDAYDYLHANIAAAGTTVAFRADGLIDALIVFQKGATSTESYVIALDGINGVTLSNTAGTNKVYIEDTSAPMINNAAATLTGLNLYFSETVSAITTTGVKLYKNGITDMGTLSQTISGATVTLASSTASLLATDFVVVDVNATVAATNTATDTTGHTGLYVTEGAFKMAFGGSENNTINLSTLTAVTEADGGAGDDTLTGTIGSDFLAGGIGNDTLNGSDGDDDLEGDGGNDILNGGTGNDRLSGGKGNDILDSGTGYDNMDGGEGNDTYYLRESGNFWENNSDVTIGGYDIAYSWATTNSMRNIEELHIMSSGNTITYGSGVNDLIYAGAGNDTIYGNGGVDTVSYIDATSSVTVDLLSQTATGFGADTLVWIQNITGSSYNDNITGDNNANLLIGGDGNDYFSAKDGNDEIYGGNGDDNIGGGGGNDIIDGGAGNDTLRYSNTGSGVTVDLRIVGVAQNTGPSGLDTITSIENLSGSSFNDTLTGDDNDNILSGGDGKDNFSANGGNDTIYGGNGDDNIGAGLGNDYIDGGDGIDTYRMVSSDVAVTVDLTVTTAQNTRGTEYDTIINIENLIGSAHDDTLTGNSGDNIITGNDGNDIIDGGSGIDTMIGGLGNDTYYVDNVGDVTTETSTLSTEIDTVVSSISLSLGASANVENITLSGIAIIDAIGNDLDNRLTGNNANNTLDGSTGSDTMLGGLGNDTYYVDNAGDVVTENVGEGTDTVIASISHTLSANVENLTLAASAGAINGTGNELNNIITGNAENNILNGENGNDTLDGGMGTDTMVGGLGNDTYYVDNSGDVTTETSTLSTEIDTVISTVSYSLGSNLENLSLSGTAVIDAIGNSLDNRLTGNSAANKLNGGAGVDIMVGGLGNDTYYVDNVGDIVSDTSTLSTEIDTVISTVSYAIKGYVENLTLSGTAAIDGTGNTLNNRLTGNSANNVLNGLSGADIMVGGLGNDTYYVDNVGDIVSETSTLSTEIDTVISTVSYAIKGYVENLTLSGTGNISANGNYLDNILIGNNGANSINGISGADTMIGGLGNDTYYVDNVGDTVTENPGEGTDILISSISYTLSSNVENMILSGTDSLNAIGNNLNNRISGNSADNILDGSTGADIMVGGLGNDTYYVDNVGDIVSETSTLFTEIDTVISTVSYAIKGYVENLTLTGIAINGIGNTLDNTIIGNSMNNSLSGSSGNDTLTGGDGSDVFLFNSALNGTTNVDTITDFIAVDDTIRLENTYFSSLATIGTLSASNFVASENGAAVDGDDYILYNTTSGALSYDQDGIGGIAAVQFALLGVSVHPTITNVDFIIS